MQKSRISKEQSGALRGLEVIEEAARFLRQLHFTANEGARAKGQHVAVSVDPRWNDDGGDICVLVTCYALRQRRVDWKGIPIFVLPIGKKTGGWIAFLDVRGQRIIPNLPLDDYRLSTSPRYGRSTDLISLPSHERKILRARSKRVGKGAALYESTDGQLRANVCRTQAGTMKVTFETSDATLDGATVRFAFARKSGQVEYNAEVTLEQVEGEQNLWKGCWEEELELSEPCELVFEVLPRKGSEKPSTPI